MQLESFTFNPFSQNTYVAYQNNTCVVIDPGNSNPTEDKILLDFIQNNQLHLSGIYLTHSHIDHILGIKTLVDKYNCPVYLHPLDLPIWEMAEKTAAMYGIFYNPSYCNVLPFSASNTITDLQTTLQIRFVPGHSPGHVVFINTAQEFVIAGDTLFQGSIGRTDLSFGNHNQLIHAIKEQLFTLPANYTVYSGHGPQTIIGQEIRTNPFFTNN